MMMIFPSDYTVGNLEQEYGMNAKLNDIFIAEYLTIEELKTIYGLLEHYYIPYENLEALLLVKKIREILENVEK